jgi:hypothetical protein
MTRSFGDYLGRNSALYGQDLIRGLGIKAPPVSEYEVAEFIGCEIREVYEEDLAAWPGRQDILQEACAHLLKRENLIVVNGEMRRARKRTCVFHESGHCITPWHCSLNYACTEKAIEPVFHQLIEREAFTCGAEIQMPRHLFIPDTLDLPLGIDAIKTLAVRYDATLETTAIRYAQLNRRICAIVVVEPAENHGSKATAHYDPPNQLVFPFRSLPAVALTRDDNPRPLRVKYFVKAPRFPIYIPPGTGIAEENPIFDTWNTRIALHAELPASVFGFFSKEVYNAEIVPLGNTGMVMALLSLLDHQLVLDSWWETIP